MIYFTSDLHFYHINIIRLCQRPFNTIEEMHNVLIENWNLHVRDNDEIYILGDFLMSKSQNDGIYANEILKQLRGKKYLIIGNHDKGFLESREFDQSLFKWIKPYYELKYNKVKYVLFHYPILEWNGYYRHHVHLYGHVHNQNFKSDEMKERLNILGNMAYNVGVDVNNFTPVRIDEIEERMCN